MPDCVFVHFVEGLRSSSYLEAEFSSKDGSLYTVTQFIHYSKDPDHFSCWTKEHKGELTSLVLLLMIRNPGLQVNISSWKDMPDQVTILVGPNRN